ILGLDGRDRVYLVRAPHGRGRRFRKAEGSHFTGSHQIGHGACRVLDRNPGIYPVQKYRSMTSVLRRCRDASQESRTFSGLPSTALFSNNEPWTMPNFVAKTTPSRRPRRALPTLISQSP